MAHPTVDMNAELRGDISLTLSPTVSFTEVPQWHEEHRDKCSSPGLPTVLHLSDIGPNSLALYIPSFNPDQDLTLYSTHTVAKQSTT